MGAIALWAAMAAGAWGQCIGGNCGVPERPHPAVVRIVNRVATGTAYGSGTLVAAMAGEGTVITCAHLFRDGQGSVSVEFADGSRSAGRVLAVDAAWDLASIRVGATAVAPVAVAAGPPRAGTPLASCGYGSDGRYQCNRGVVLGYCRSGEQPTAETLLLSGSARPGDSGGPVFNADGELAAVLWGTDGRTVSATYCGRVREFLARRGGPRGDGRPGVEEPPVGLANDVGRQLPAIAERVESLHRALAESQAKNALAAGQVTGRIERLEATMASLAGLDERVAHAEAATSRDQLKDVVRDLTQGVATQHAPSLLPAALLAALTALGWTGPPAVAAVVGLKIVAALVARRRRLAKVTTTGRQKNRGGKLDDGYAGELARLYALSGRSTLADATLGREYDEEMRQAATSSDGHLAAWARGVRDRVARRFYRIHAESPLPAETACP